MAAHTTGRPTPPTRSSLLPSAPLFFGKSRPQQESRRKSSWLLHNVLLLLSIACVGICFLVLAFESKLRVARHHHSLHDAEPLEDDTVMEEDNPHSISSRTRRQQPRSSRTASATAESSQSLYRWTPTNHAQCVSRQQHWLLDPFAPNFEQELYAEIYGQGKDHHHYEQIGRALGYECTRGQRLRQVINTEILPLMEDVIHQSNDLNPPGILEIGPFLNPMLIGKDVKYFDVLPLDQLQERAERIGFPSVHPVAIDFVHPHGDLFAAISGQQQFALIASANVLPNQMDLVRHLQAVGQLLVNDGGYYVMTVRKIQEMASLIYLTLVLRQLSDKRRMFDSFLPTTSIADVLQDYYEDNNSTYVSTHNHRMKSIIEHRALTMQSTRHWSSGTNSPFHRRPDRVSDFTDKVQQAVQESTLASSYIDVHNYHFTPQSLAFIIDTLFQLQLIDVRVHRLYDTMHGSSEFGIVLQKCSSAHVGER